MSIWVFQIGCTNELFSVFDKAKCFRLAVEMLSRALRKIVRRTFGLHPSANIEPLHTLLNIPSVKQTLVKLKACALSKWALLPPERLANVMLTHSSEEQRRSCAWQCKRVSDILGVDAASSSKPLLTELVGTQVDELMVRERRHAALAIGRRADVAK